ncbi:MAG: hypothetical protein RLZZ74_3454 [Cyanobacteriota bacterium]|jgi:hypothetical protein
MMVDMDLREWVIENALELNYEITIILGDFETKGINECRSLLLLKVMEWDKKRRELLFSDR